jgi:hypothetical protein
MVAPWSQNQWIQSSHITHTFDHKTNMYSKPMTVTTARIDVPCHTMQIILSVFYMHVSFTSPTLLIYSAQRFSLNARVHVQQV